MKGECKPFLKWAGGKTQLLGEIESKLPSEIYTWKSFTYLEPFVGSGAVLFWMIRTFPNLEKAVINDINPDLAMAYRAIKQHPKKLIAALTEIQDEYYAFKSEEKKKEFFLKKREIYNTRELDTIAHTALLVFLNRTCFNGLYRVNSKGHFNVPFGYYAKPKICDETTIMADSEALQKVEILNGDFAETLNYSAKNSFFYFDPPYKPLSNTSSFNSYAKDSFDDKEQERLKHFCELVNIKGHSWMLSNSDVRSNDPENHYFDKLYQRFNINRVLAKRSINANPEKRGILSELLITNYVANQTFQNV